MSAVFSDYTVRSRRKKRRGRGEKKRKGKEGGSAYKTSGNWSVLIKEYRNMSLEVRTGYYSFVAVKRYRRPQKSLRRRRRRRNTGFGEKERTTRATKKRRKRRKDKDSYHIGVCT